MKTILLALGLLSGSFGWSWALGQERSVRIEALPREARQLLDTYFNSDPVVKAVRDDDWAGATYEVRLNSGTELDFDKEGRWVEVDCAPRAVPRELIPAAIRADLEDRFPGEQVVKIERDRRGYELKLAGGAELKYSAKFRLQACDD